MSPARTWLTFSHAAAGAVLRDRRLGRIWRDREPAAYLEPFNLLHRNQMMENEPPQHTRLRKIISRGFTPRAIGRLEEELAQRAQNIVKAAAAEGGGDFVEQVSCELPLQAIAGLLGVPQEDRDKLFRWSNEMTAGEDPEYADVDPALWPAAELSVRAQLAYLRSRDEE